MVLRPYCFQSKLQRANASEKVPMPKEPAKAKAIYIYIYTYIYICFVLLLFCNTLCVCLAYSFNKQVALEPPEIPAVTPFSKIQLAAHKRLQAAEQNGKGAQTKRKGTGKGGKDTQKKTKENKAGRSVLCTF